MIKRFGGEQEAWNINGATLIGFYITIKSMLNKEITIITLIIYFWSVLNFPISTTGEILTGTKFIT